MGLVKILDHVNQCYSNADGAVIFCLVDAQFRNGDKVVVSFEGVDSTSSSFVNSAFIELLDKYDFDFIKTHLSFVNSLRPINDMIKRRFAFEVNERKNLVSV